MKIPILFCAALCLGGALRLSAADVGYYGVVKAIQYEQNSASVPALLPTNAYRFNAFVVATTNNVVTNATVKPSNSTPLRTLAAYTNDMAWMYEDFFTSDTTFNQVYPTGALLSPASYTVRTYSVNDGIQSGSIGFSLLGFPISYPVIPRITNLVAAQAIDNTRDFALGWNDLGGSTLAIVQLTVFDSLSNLVYATPAPFQPGALTGSSRGDVIPAYALAPGTNFEAHLTIANPGMPNTNSIPGALGVAALARDTRFALTSRPAAIQPRLELLDRTGLSTRLQLSGESNRLYQILSSADLLSWTNRYTTNSVEGALIYTDTEPTDSGLRFYRAKVGQ